MSTVLSGLARSSAVGQQQDIVLPSLLDRLVDDGPGSGDKRAFSIQRLRAAVLRDLSWLLNTADLQSSIDLEPYPRVAASTLNYGVRSLTGFNREGMDIDACRFALIVALQRYEPRLIPSSIRVAVISDAANPATMCFQIEADLWAQPMPVRMVMRTEIEPQLRLVRVVETKAENG